MSNILQAHMGTSLLTHLCLASRKKALANSVDPDETPHDAASHQGLRCLLKGISVRNILNIEINILDIPNFGNKLIQFRRMGESTRHKWVNFVLSVRFVLLFMILSRFVLIRHCVSCPKQKTSPDNAYGIPLVSLN